MENILPLVACKGTAAWGCMTNLHLATVPLYLGYIGQGVRICHTPPLGEAFASSNLKSSFQPRDYNSEYKLF